MRQNTETIKNKKTGLRETIIQECESTDWGINYYVKTEMDAYKTAYLHRDCKHGSRVRYAEGLGMWLVTVFNEGAKAAGIDCAR